MDKIITLSTVSSQGEPLVRPLNDGRRVLTKIASAMQPEVVDFMRQLQPNQDRLYLLLSGSTMQEGAPVFDLKTVNELIRAERDAVKPSVVGESVRRGVEKALPSGDF